MAVTHTGANVPDARPVAELLETLPSFSQPPVLALADRAYDHEDQVRQPLRQHGLTAFIAPRGSPHGSGLGRIRWVVEAAFAWLFQFRRLRVRYEKRVDTHDAFLELACLLICWRRFQRFC